MSYGFEVEDMMTADELRLPAHVALCARDVAERRRLEAERDKILSAMCELAYDEDANESAIYALDEEFDALSTLIKVVANDHGVVDKMTGEWYPSAEDYFRAQRR